MTHNPQVTNSLSDSKCVGGKYGAIFLDSTSGEISIAEREIRRKSSTGLRIWNPGQTSQISKQFKQFKQQQAVV